MEKQKTLQITLPSNSKVETKTIKHLDELFEFVPPKRLRTHLQTIFFSYLIHEHEFLPDDFNEMAADLHFLFEFLDGEGK